jgi:hypothetical protein
MTVQPHSASLSVSSILQDIMVERQLTRAALLRQVGKALNAYAEDPNVRDVIYRDIVDVDSRYASKTYRTIHQNRGFATVGYKTLLAALDGSRNQHEETVYKLIVWLCWTERFGNEAGQPRRSYKADAIRLVQAADRAHKTKGAAFPLNLLALKRLIRRLVANARKLGRPSLHVLAECSDLGSFFYPALHMSITNGMIELAHRHCDVRLVVYGPIQAITSASNLSALEPQIRMEHPEFQEYLKLYLKHLRYWDTSHDEKGNSIRHVPFEDWLACHRERDLGDLHEWVVRYGPADYQDIDRSLLGRWISRAHAIVFEHGSFTESCDDANALLALQWCREKYFEELLTYNNVAVRRYRSKPPPMILWLSEEQGAFGVVQTRERDVDQRGWIFSTDVVLSHQNTEPMNPRDRMMKVFESLFLSHWDNAEAVSMPAWFDAVRRGLPYADLRVVPVSNG